MPPIVVIRCSFSKVTGIFWLSDPMIPTPAFIVKILLLPKKKRYLANKPQQDEGRHV